MQHVPIFLHVDSTARDFTRMPAVAVAGAGTVGKNTVQPTTILLQGTSVRMPKIPTDSVVGTKRDSRKKTIVGVGIVAIVQNGGKAKRKRRRKRMELPKTWVYGEKVPFTESNTVEFKRVSKFSGLFIYSSSNSGLPKYKETLIGFLNSGGGYLFMGILDDGTILGVEDMTESGLDKLNLWVDSCFNCLVYKNGDPINPSELSLRIHTFPVAGKDTHIVMIEAINKGMPLDIMTRSGTIIYRLNASNYKVCVEPVYRKSDVKGMISSIQQQMQRIIDEKHRAIRDLKEAHAEEIIELKKWWCFRAKRSD
jgi:hypothetical protein